MKFRIITTSTKIEDAIKQLITHNDDEFLKSGFLLDYETTENGYYLIFKFMSPAAKAGMTNPLGRRILLAAMKSKLKEADPEIKIEFVKGED
jgi:hypothetical protein